MRSLPAQVLPDTFEVWMVFGLGMFVGAISVGFYAMIRLNAMQARLTETFNAIAAVLADGERETWFGRGDPDDVVTGSDPRDDAVPADESRIPPW
jgi:hypothetical protein